MLSGFMMRSFEGNYPAILPRKVFNSPRRVLPSRRFFFELLVGLVGVLFFAEMPALMISA